MPQHDAPRTDVSADLRIGRDWVKSLVLLVICIGVTLAAVYGIGMEAESLYDRRFQSASWLLLPTMGPFSLWVLFRLIVPIGPLVVMGPGGIADRRINAARIPWGDVTNVTNKSDFVTLTVTARFAKSYALSPSQRVLKALHKQAGPRHIKIAAWCLAVTQSELAAQIAAFRQEFSRQPSPA